MTVQKRVRRSADFPVWYHPQSPLGSAVRYLASLSPDFTFVEIRFPQKNRGKRKPHPSLGTPGKGTPWILPVKTASDRLLGEVRIEIDGPLPPESKDVVLKVIAELGELWPA